jgi:uncharacterized phage protein (TIGR01671 family)
MQQEEAGIFCRAKKESGMSREIKFRAWDSSNSEMRYSDRHDGEFYINTKGVLYMYAIPKPEGSIGKTQYYKSYESMQYTGLKDKNGVEIYEGDVLYWDGSIIGAVSFDCAEFIVGVGRNARNLCNAPYDEIEVIGNTHQSPELLEQSND